MVLEVRVSTVSSFVVEGQNWTNPIVEGPKVDFFQVSTIMVVVFNTDLCAAHLK